MDRGKGFTLIELMIVVAIIGILATIAIPITANILRKSKEGATRGSLASIRSALSIYYSDNEQQFPRDGLDSLLAGNHKLSITPKLQTPPYHVDTTASINESVASDSGQWSYDNDEDSPTWGHVSVGCSHLDMTGTIWSAY